MVFVRLSVLSAFLVLLVVAAGCGGGGSSSSSTNSKAAFIEEADARCSDYQAERQPIEEELEAIEQSANPESPKNLLRLGELLNEAIAAAEVEVESIRELEPPPADQATIGKMLDTAQEANGVGAEAGEALEVGDTSRFGELAKELEAVNNRAKGMAEGYGLKVCAQAP